MRLALVVLGLLASGCSSGNDTSTSSTTSDAGEEAGPIGGDRPVTVYVPSSYHAGTPMPLVLLLAGQSVTGDVEEIYLQLAPVAEQRGFLYAHPNGTKDKDGSPFWNATDACCDTYKSGVDDSGYLFGLIGEIAARYSVDPKRVFFVGHSNGGFMCYRMACDHAGAIAAIASLAGAMFEDTSRCKASGPVSVLEIHGTADTEVLYEGSTSENYPGAVTTTRDWASLDGCDAVPDTSAPPLDLDVSLPGAETTITRYASGCKPGGHAELWTIQGGTHIPNRTADFSSKVIDFLFAHPKP